MSWVMHRTKITKWEGNIGSNLIQLAKSVHLAKCIGSQVVLPKLIDYNLVQLQLFTIEKRKSFFKRMFSKKSTNEHALKTIPFFEKEYYDVNLDLTTDIDSSFNRSDRQYSDLEANKRVQSSLYSPRLRNICCNTIRPILLSVYHNKKKVSTEDETLVVHITSDPQKVIPPFAYIENILEYEKYTKIIIISNDYILRRHYNIQVFR